MSTEDVELDQYESRVVARAANDAVTRRRIWLSVIVPLGLIALLLLLFWRDARPRMLLWLFVGYVAINMLEKVGYGLAVLLYKSVIRKLVAQLRDLQRPPADR